MKISTVNEKYKITYKAYYNEISNNGQRLYDNDVTLAGEDLIIVEADLSNLIPNEVIDYAYFYLNIQEIPESSWAALINYIESDSRLSAANRYELCFILYCIEESLNDQGDN